MWERNSCDILNVSTCARSALISDVMMPKMTGIEAAVQVMAQRPSCKVVLFSGQPASADVLQQAEALGHSFEIFAKPFHPDHLL